jgi:hypothetical protein
MWFGGPVAAAHKGSLRTVGQGGTMAGCAGFDDGGGASVKGWTCTRWLTF